MLVQDVEILNLLNIMLILFIDVHLISLPTNIGWTNLMQCSWTWKAAFLDLLRAYSLVARDENIDRFASVEMASYCCAWIPGTDVFLAVLASCFFLLPVFLWARHSKWIRTEGLGASKWSLCWCWLCCCLIAIRYFDVFCGQCLGVAWKEAGDMNVQCISLPKLGAQKL